MLKCILKVVDKCAPKLPSNLRAAAVLVLIAGSTIILTKRSQWLRYGGMVVFPGGAIEADEDAIDASLREAKEEIRAHVSRNSVVGFLPPIECDEFYIVPVVAVVDRLPQMECNPDEVEEIYCAPFDTIDTQQTTFELAGSTVQIIESLRGRVRREEFIFA